ncbi:ABC transporter ATP-binding protein [Noviherbaspirillum denitrificans]|uniref:ABC transporter ATP-binding protein n=2 Tax=Noviherbaspirillum denitrificans TaxID=1968433 RepID=A0A254THI3_9BURK|nr:ABC transporter ATP-binding protein [Noviherbaspirillum denitrificans]
MLAIQNVSVDHGNLRALWDVSLDVNAGERVGLLGANGAGKSTLMGAIVGLYRTSGGTIQYSGTSLGRATTEDTVGLGIALVPEGRHLFPQMSVQENLDMGTYASSGGSSEEMMEKVFGLFPILKQKAKQNAGELSGGQQQMVAIGRALMSAPKMLLLDEPFIGVAPKVVDEILETLHGIAAGGVTMVLVEQNTHRALGFVERAYVLENGRTVLNGSADELLNDPDFSRKFLGLE